MLIVIMIGPAFAMDAIEGVLTCEIMLSCTMMTTLARLRERHGREAIILAGFKRTMIENCNLEGEGWIKSIDEVMTRG